MKKKPLAPSIKLIVRVTRTVIEDCEIEVPNGYNGINADRKVVNAALNKLNYNDFAEIDSSRSVEVFEVLESNGKVSEIDITHLIQPNLKFV